MIKGLKFYAELLGPEFLRLFERVESISTEVDCAFITHR